MSFPKDFVWGAASSAYQIEGGWDADGKGHSIWDDFCHSGGYIKNNETGDIACDSYHRYAEDVALIKKMGLNAYRFSVSWPRIFPEGRGRINQAGLDYYDKLVDLLLGEGITPYLTLFHWELPSVLQENGGWLNRDTSDAFGEYAALIAQHFDGRVRHYITINEPQCIVWLGHANGLHAPGYKLPAAELVHCAHHVLLAHGKAVQALRNASSSRVEIGIASTGNLCYPNIDTPKACDAAYNATFEIKDDSWMFTHTWFLDAAILGAYPKPPLEVSRNSVLCQFIDAVKQEDMDAICQRIDFLGANIYNGKEINDNGQRERKRTGYPRTAQKWPITPEVMNYGCHWLYQRYQLPIFVTENGQSCNDRIFLDGGVHDSDRIDFLHRYLVELKKACEKGVPILGYMHWCLTDNFEWNEGYDERFGLIYIDFPSQRRIMKDSAKWFSGVVAANGDNL